MSETSELHQSEQPVKTHPLVPSLVAKGLTRMYGCCTAPQDTRVPQKDTENDSTTLPPKGGLLSQNLHARNFDGLFSLLVAAPEWEVIHHPLSAVAIPTTKKSYLKADHFG